VLFNQYGSYWRNDDDASILSCHIDSREIKPALEIIVSIALGNRRLCAPGPASFKISRASFPYPEGPLSSVVQGFLVDDLWLAVVRPFTGFEDEA